MSTHHRIPWHKEIGSFVYVVDKVGSQVAIVDSEDDADLIALAVNAHADLVAALKSARAAIDDMLRFPDQEPLGEAAIGIIDAALKKAGAL